MKMIWALGLIQLFVQNLNASEIKLSPWLKLDQHEISQENLPAIRDFILNSVSLLPERVQLLLEKKSIKIKFKKSHKALPDNLCTADFKFASSHFFTDTIELTSLLIPEIMKGPEQAGRFPCGHGSYYQLAKSVILHELTHFYDEQEKVSENKQFLNLSGWVKSPIFRKRSQGNKLTIRSSDPYEFKDRREALAVKTEFFLLDPNFQCREPSMYLFLQKEFQHTPFPKDSCQLNTKAYLRTTGLSEGRAGILSLDPERLYQVHYMVAGTGKEVFSKWGHAMFRLVFCSPEREKMGPECLTQDLAHHLVLSYRANVQDLVVDHLKGVVGKYPSQMYLFKLSEIVNEYTLDEFRDIISVPLKITKDQRRLFLLHTLEQHWAYQGRYKFFTNNCSTEALNFLKSLFHEQEEKYLHASNPLAPNYLIKTLAKLDFFEGDIVNPKGKLWDKSEAETQGYFFRSAEAQMEKTFSELQKQGAIQGYQDLLDYFKHSQAREREQMVHQLYADSNLSESERKKQILRFMNLEAQIIRLRKRAYINKIVEASSEDKKHLPFQLAEFIKLQAKIEPWNLVSKNPWSYGIPLETDFNEKVRDRERKILAQIEGLKSSVENWATTQFATEVAEVKSSIQNRKTFYRLSSHLNL